MVDKVIDIRRVSQRMITIMALVHGIIISVVSVYGLQNGLDDNQKDSYASFGQERGR